MRRALLLLLLIGLPASARAMWAYVDVETLVQESDLIVVGTLQDVSEHTADGRDYGQGRIQVREVIWGRVSPGDSLLLKWSNSSAIACPRVEHRYNEGKEGVWLLTSDGEAVAANYPGRFVELSERRKVEAALARSPVVLRAGRFWVGLGEPMPFSVVYRNVSDTPRTFPGVTFEGGRLRLAPGSRIAVKVELDGEEGSRQARLEGRVVRDRGLAPVTVEPRGERRVEIDLRELLANEPVDRESYEITLRLEGQPPTNALDFYVSSETFFQSPAARPAAPPEEKSVYVFSQPRREGLAPLMRAGLAALAALFLFPFFYKLRAALSGARLARVAQGAQTWQN